jgi:cell division protein ZapA
MSEKIKVKISIADRVYPLNIFPEEEKEIRRIAQRIDGLIKEFEKNYAVRDKQDVLAMCTLQFASQLEKTDNQYKIDVEETVEKLNALNTLINKLN